MPRLSLLLFALVAFLSLAASGAPAQQESETDRLREALRSTIAQLRALEDERATLTAKQAEGERERASLVKQLAATKEQIKAVEKAHREAVETFNQRLKEHDEALEKWKVAYEQAADLARAKDAERAQFEAEAKSFKASTKACADRNIKLVAVGKDLLDRLGHVTLGDRLVATEPLVGFKRAEVINMLQDYEDKILEQKASP